MGKCCGISGRRDRPRRSERNERAENPRRGRFDLASDLHGGQRIEIPPIAIVHAMHAQSTSGRVGARSHVPIGAEGNRTLSLSIANAGVAWGFLETRRHGEASSSVRSGSREPPNHGVVRAIEPVGPPASSLSGSPHVFPDSVSPFHGFDHACLFRSGTCEEDHEEDGTHPMPGRGYGRTNDRRSDNRASRQIRRPMSPDRQREHDPRGSVLPERGLLIRGRGRMARPRAQIQAGPSPGGQV